MSDQTPDTQNISPESMPNDAVDPSRRKLTGAVLGAGAVFTLASRPVWANQCTISGMQSGNLSRTTHETCDGCTPGYWKQPQHLDSWGATGFIPEDTTTQSADTFNTVFGVTNYVRNNGTPYTLLEVMRELNGNGDPISTNLGFHAVAALLNAAHPNVNYGYTSGEIITLFQNSVAKGPAAAAALKDMLVLLNEGNGMFPRSCPLN